jgi:hypothetical protein
LDPVKKERVTCQEDEAPKERESELAFTARAVRTTTPRQRLRGGERTGIGAKTVQEGRGLSREAQNAPAFKTMVVE